MLRPILGALWNRTALCFISNRRRRLLNGTDYMKSKSGYAGRVRAKKQAPCKKLQMDKVRCAHLLLKHKDSRNPVNRNTGAAVTRTKEEARALMEGYLSQILSSERPDHEFRRLATEKSECSSARNGGDLGFFDRRAMQKAFSDASFSLKVNQFSQLVETDSGVHIIYRIA